MLQANTWAGTAAHGTESQKSVSSSRHLVTFDIWSSTLIEKSKKLDVRKLDHRNRTGEQNSTWEDH